MKRSFLIGILLGTIVLMSTSAIASDAKEKVFDYSVEICDFDFSLEADFIFHSFGTQVNGVEIAKSEKIFVGSTSVHCTDLAFKRGMFPLAREFVIRVQTHSDSTRNS